jgi:transketolase
VGLHGAVIGVDQFGMSSPAETILERFQISAERIVELALGMV